MCLDTKLHFQADQQAAGAAAAGAAAADAKAGKDGKPRVEVGSLEEVLVSGAVYLFSGCRISRFQDIQSLFLVSSRNKDYVLDRRRQQITG